MNSSHHTHDDDHDQEAFSRRLRARLDAEVADLPAGGGPEAAVARARSRRRNRRTALASAAALAVIAGASTQALTADPGEADIATASQGVFVDESLAFDWTVTDGGLSYAQSVSAGDSGLYALSTAPGTRAGDHPEEAPRAMYRLADDGTWAPIALDGDDPNVATMSERGGVLYALSTGTATDVEARPQASVSEDGGETWSSVPLQTATAPSDGLAWTVSYSLDLASTADETVALVSARFRLPYEDLFPELFEDEAPDGGGGYATEMTDEGVDLVRYEEGPSVAAGNEVARDGGPAPSTTGPGGDHATEVVRSVTWADLGITGPSDLAPQRWAYVADGEAWTEVPSPIVPRSHEDGHVDLAAVDGAFVLTVVEYSADGDRSTAHRSLDGRDWTAVHQPGPGQLLAAGDALLHIGYEPAGTIVHISRDGGTSWEPLDLSSLDPSLGDLSDQAHVWGRSGPLGVAVIIGEPEHHGSRTMLFSTDLERWSVTHLDDIAADGTFFGDVIVGTDNVVLLGHTGEGEPGSPERSATLVGVPRQT